MIKFRETIEKKRFMIQLPRCCISGETVQVYLLQQDNDTAGEVGNILVTCHVSYDVSHMLSHHNYFILSLYYPPCQCISIKHKSH